MAKISSNSGLDELLQLSQQFKGQEHEVTRRESQRARQNEQTQDVVGELRTLSISTAVGQLRLVSTPEIIEQVNSLKKNQETSTLRKLIGNLIYDLENRIGVLAVADQNIKAIEPSMKTLAILVGLSFSLSD